MPSEKAAQEAAQAYNGIELDGSKMSVLVANQPTVWTGTGNKRLNTGNENSPSKPGPSKHFELKRKEMTVDDLDAELDEYRKSRGGKNVEKMDTR